MATGMYIRNKPNVLISYGKLRTALLDLHTQEIIHLDSEDSLRLRDLEATNFLLSKEDAEQDGLLHQLCSMGFFQKYKSLSNYANFDLSVDDFFFKVCHILALEVNLQTYETGFFSSLLKEVSKRMFCEQVLIILEDADVKNEDIFSVLCNDVVNASYFYCQIFVKNIEVINQQFISILKNYENFELILDSEVDSDILSSVANELAKENIPFIVSSLFGMKKLSEHDLIVDEISVKSLANGSYLSHLIYIDSNKDCYLDLNKTIKVQQLKNDVDVGLKPALFAKYWSIGKNSFSKCCDCEFKLCCSLSFSDYKATNEHTVNSVCDYDPHLGQRNIKPLINIGNSKYVYLFSDSGINDAKLLLDSIDNFIFNACSFLGIELPSAKIRITFYQNSDKNTVYETGKTVVTYIDGERSSEIFTIYEFHCHEIMHAIINTVNEQPNFAVSEGMASVFGICKSLRTINTKSNLRALDVGPTEIIHGDYGQIIYPESLYNSDDVHQISKNLLERGLNVSLLSELNIQPNNNFNPNSYYILGSFFKYIIEEFAESSAVSLICSSNIEEYLKKECSLDIDEAQKRWECYLNNY